jgi:tetratricopeptide (TPR) repeat protein
MDGHFPAARSAFESALAILGKNHQGADLIAGICLNNLAEVLRNLGKLSEAEGDAQRSLSIERKVGASSLDLTLPLITLGLIYNDLGMYPKSLASLKDAQAIDEKELEPLDVAIVRDLMNLATVYMGENDLISAQHLLEEALSIVQKSGRVDSLEAAGVLYNLGRVYDDEGEYSKARPDLERALAISQEKLGPVNYRVATVLSGLGRLSIDEKNFPEAEKLLREALKINEEVLGPTHLSVGSDHDYLGFLYASEEFYLAAETHYLLAYSIYVNSLGPAHPLVGNVASAIANILRREGRDADAAYYENIGAKAKKPSDGELSLGKPDNR